MTDHDDERPGRPWYLGPDEGRHRGRPDGRPPEGGSGDPASLRTSASRAQGPPRAPGAREDAWSPGAGAAPARSHRGGSPYRVPAGPDAPPEQPLGSRRARSRARPRTDAGLARQVAAAASLAAGAVHVAATPAHLEEWLAAGAFFAATALFQLVWGLAALALRSTFLQVCGLIANLGVLGVWAVSRLVGMPFGPAAGVPEAVGAADLVAAALGAVVVTGALCSLLPRERHGVLTAGGYRGALVLAFGVLGAAAVPGATAALEHSHAGGGHGHAEGGHGHGGGEEAAESAEPSAGSTGPAEPSGGGETGGQDPSGQGRGPAEQPPADDGHTHAPGEGHG
ncbi:hypothetical protein [Nocardiopsis suaedae]|uniref:Uncharacterized protein n=1 Tax=Nocardiopsis suaedae TaxID=3018444 RepID=A0ABT4TQB0_9ACTN|nr:hypothetical protein [Nocardiopsis suaedae]MDA2806873.1 hypothetical protein [Nocardiopsis suaedae]